VIALVIPNWTGTSTRSQQGSFLFQFAWRRKRNAKIVQALHVARYMLVIHDGKAIRHEGEEWQLDFGR
jgi:hypothetical protein